MPRTEIPFIVQTQSGAVVQGASIQVNNRVGGGASVIYAAETGGSTLPNPLTTGLSGRVDGWLEEGQYTLVVSGPGITTYSQPWDVRSGGPIGRYGNAVLGNVGPASQGGVGLGPDPSDVVLYRTGVAAARLNSSLTIDGSSSIGQALLVGTALSFAVQDSTGSGLLKANFASAFADSANVPRLEVGNNTANNDALVSGLTGIALRRFGVAAQGITIGNTIATGLPIPTTDSLRVEYAGGRDTLHLASTATDTGITIGGDVEVYRSAANVLKSPDTFDAGGFRQGGVALASTHLSDAANVGLLDSARTWTAIQTHTADVLHQSADVRVRQSGDTFDKVRLGWDGFIYFGSGAAAYDVTFRRTGVGALRSSGTLDAATSITANIGGANQVALGVASAGLVLGSAGDTNLYRSGANTLKTDDAFHALGTIVANQAGGVAQVSLGALGPANEAAIILGDVTIRRSSANNVTVDGDFRVGNLYVSGSQTNIGDQTSVGPLVAGFGLSGQVRLGSDPTGTPTITFGTAEDTSLYRDGANKLRTGDALQVDGLFTATAGAAISGAALTINRATATNETLAIQTAGTTRLRILANGTLEWADATGLADANTQLVRSAAGVLTTAATLNAVAFQVAGTALASTHLSDSAALARLASPTFTGTVTVPVLAITTREESPAGTFGAPSQTFVGDTDTGIYSPGANQFGISTAGASRLTIAADGTVAIAGALTVGGLTPVFTNDARLSDVRVPTGPAGGELAGSYPNPTVATGVITNAHISATAAIADTKLATIATLGKIADTAIPSTIARLASPTFTGTPLAPTAAVNTNTTQLATTAFVLGQAATLLPIMDGTATIGTALRYAREDHVHGTDTTRAPLASPTFTGTVTASVLSVTGGGGITVSSGITSAGVATGAVSASGTIQTANGQIIGVQNTGGTVTGIQVDASNNILIGSQDGSGFVTTRLRGGNAIAFDVANAQRGSISNAGVFSWTGAMTVGGQAVVTTNDTRLVTRPTNSATEDLRIVRGRVDAAGNGPLDGSGFTISHPSTGEYVITFDTAFVSDFPSVTVTAYNGAVTAAPIFASIMSLTTGSVTVRMWASGGAIDNSFNFIAIGPR